MSKYVKNLITDHLRGELTDVQDALLVNMIGLDANANNRLRGELEQKGIKVMVVKNSLAQRATEGTPLASMFDGLTGTSAICWGGEDVVSLAKEVVRLSGESDYEAFAPRAGVMDGDTLTSDEVIAVSKWPSREEQVSILVGQFTGVGATLAAQLTGPGSSLASQIAQKADGDDEAEAGEEAAEAAE